MYFNQKNTTLNFARSILCSFFFYIWAITIGLIMLPAAFILPRKGFKFFVTTWAHGNSFILLIISNIRVEIKGKEFIPQGAAIVASKHQSEWETNVFLYLLKDPVYVMKKELLYIPGYGLFAQRMGMIFVDRQGHVRTLRSLIRKAKKAFKKGRPLVIFPEGTRLMPGEKGPYRTGVLGIYSECKVPIVPVVLNSGLCWPPRSFRKYPGTITIEFLPHIPPGIQKDEALKRLQNCMENASDKLLQKPI
ncbi:MAG: 1-acyl-sn-glycerol-3-phosphate acyltransferase [Rhodospirillaceae bacterium]|nr:1-acyl-sn-glycerol-3-phosphate acyltransferase [Alphaproteobacteria bacterium]MBR72950.1 1-acyl-sn-glycerol-3-phosphate acyltransferase [Rhodospirillaceae bacterium]